MTRKSFFIVTIAILTVIAVFYYTYQMRPEISGNVQAIHKTEIYC
ncbi:hypothetical protein X560_1717 [Listeria fleischmannii 1991]|uniref:Uncharacterized protein n=2 Tax=Listeria fleischmannii TaxID=1069827 RepID=A0A2X3HHY2_9LIST|nr:hypothetical protein [Listeria fleischmannii]KMT59176.1 hypothetical protein X560_1717 [Listeria fleischmannii 1991]SQC72183.1 Uncharacterised protein [Listeria fleischmannii subsp. fleischmannii]